MGETDSAGLTRRRAIGAVAAAGLTAPAARADAQEPAAPKPQAAKMADVASVDSIVAALYDVISGPKGQARKWDRFRSLFVPGARLIPCGQAKGSETVTSRVFTAEEFVKLASASTDKSGFYESEVSRRVDKFGHIAQVFSTYESRREKGEAPFSRGINSIQLL